MNDFITSAIRNLEQRGGDLNYEGQAQLEFQALAEAQIAQAIELENIVAAKVAEVETLMRIATALERVATSMAADDSLRKIEYDLLVREAQRLAQAENEAYDKNMKPEGWMEPEDFFQEVENDK